MPTASEHHSSGGARTIVLLSVLFVLAWMSIARAWDNRVTYPRHLRHKHILTQPVDIVTERLPAWHRDAG